MGKRILVVDDDPDLREATEIILTGAGFEVALADSAEAAWEALAAQPVDLILLDVMMETDTEGFHLAYRIRQDEKLKDIPILMLTSIEEKMGEAIPADEAGDFLPVDAYLRKPLDPDALKSKVAELLN